MFYIFILQTFRSISSISTFAETERKHDVYAHSILQYPMFWISDLLQQLLSGQQYWISFLRKDYKCLTFWWLNFNIKTFPETATFSLIQDWSFWFCRTVPCCWGSFANLAAVCSTDADLTQFTHKVYKQSSESFIQPKPSLSTVYHKRFA